MDAESLYVQLSRLIETMPPLEAQGPYLQETHLWLGRAVALVEESGNIIDASTIRTEIGKAIGASQPGMREAAAKQIIGHVFRAFARAEARAPANIHGAFIPAGNVFDALTVIGKVLNRATRDILIVDPYIDEKALTDFALLASEGVLIRLLTDQRGHKPTLRPGLERWRLQYGANRPLEVRLAAAGKLHDRLIMVDSAEVWILTQSLNAFATRSPASVARADNDSATLKINAFQEYWDNATQMT
jgi:hypothetical protein